MSFEGPWVVDQFGKGESSSSSHEFERTSFASKDVAMGNSGGGGNWQRLESVKISLSSAI